jgi:nucleoside-diphosphate-sugar epimerase
VHELRSREYDVVAIDLQGEALRADVTDFGQTVEALAGVQAVVHLAAIPAPGLSSEETTFRTNITSTYNVFEAARILDLERIVWASSETILGLPFEREQPAYAPLDEEHPPYPESGYALSKLLGEELARQFSRWTGKPAAGLRFSNIMELADYEAFPSYWDDARKRAWNLWGYVDARDVGRSCRLALEADLAGAEHFIVAAADTVMNRASSELMAEVFPDVPYEPGGGEFDSLLATAKAERLLGYVPQHSWRAHV